MSIIFEDRKVFLTTMGIGALLYCISLYYLISSPGIPNLSTLFNYMTGSSENLDQFYPTKIIVLIGFTTVMLFFLLVTSGKGTIFHLRDGNLVDGAINFSAVIIILLAGTYYLTTAFNSFAALILVAIFVVFMLMDSTTSNRRRY